MNNSYLFEFNLFDFFNAIARIRLINYFFIFNHRIPVNFINLNMTEKTKKNKIAWSDDLSYDSEEERGF